MASNNRFVSNLVTRKYFTKNAMSLCLAMATAAPITIAYAQDSESLDPSLEEVVVTGFRNAQISAVNNKRNAPSIMDSIVADDIGKLPDVTISDSLQRISGVQIRRTAGEGGQVNVRGLPQVLSMLNGESYMSAGTVTEVQPDFNDVPSQLFGGVDVIKSPLAKNPAGGITGTINLKTRRPFDLDEGLTFAGSAELQSGAETEESDTSFSGLVASNNDGFGALFSFAYSDVTLANNYAGMAGGGSDAGWSGLPPEAGSDSDNWNFHGVDVNNDGDTDDKFIQYQGHTAYNRVVERERLGLNGSLQFNLGAGFELTTDYFYTDIEEYTFATGVSISDKWQQWGWANPDVSRDLDAGGIHSVQVYGADGRRLKSYSEANVVTAESSNLNVELNYDNGGDFTGYARAVIGSAERSKINSYADIDMADGSQWGVATANYASGPAATNPNGYSDAFQSLTIDYRGDNPVWSGVPALVGNIDGYSIGGLSSENNFDREGDLSIFSFGGEYEVGGILESIEGGVRFSSREAKNHQYHLLAPFGPDNCLVRWKAADVVLDKGSCSYGDGNGTYYTAGNPTPLSSFGSDAILVSDFGDVQGIPAVYALDPRAMSDVVGFHNALYPGNVKGMIPGESYKVVLDEMSYFMQANLNVNDFVTGNVGFRIIDTDLEVTRNVTGSSADYGAPAASDGTDVSSRSYTDFLPSANFTFAFTDELLLKTGYAKTMAPLDLKQWGDGLAVTYAINSNTGVFEVQSANQNGNPELDPWRADNFDVSLEYYMGPGSMVSLGYFYVDIESFIQRGAVEMELPDQDGVVRGVTSVATNVQGDGGEISGFELSTKQSFESLPGVLSNTGVDASFTYAPSDSGNKDLNGNKIAFQDNSERLMNVALWYEGERLQTRLAYNYRSERVVAFDQVWTTPGMTLMQDETSYIDASVSYEVVEGATVYLNASNLTGEKEDYYLHTKDQKAWQNAYEPRYTLGVRASF